MASNGLIITAKTGRCHICQRVRKTTKYVKAVGEVRHGYATGHVWECIDQESCIAHAHKELEREDINPVKRARIKTGLSEGHYDHWKVFQ